MRLLLLALAFLFLCTSACAQHTQTFQHPKTFEVLEEESYLGHTAKWLIVTPYGVQGSDTLSVWVQSIQRERGPARGLAVGADRVVWCYPKKYPDPRHLFPKTEIVVALREERNGKHLIAFMPEKIYERVYAPLVGSGALIRLH